VAPTPTLMGSVMRSPTAIDGHERECQNRLMPGLNIAAPHRASTAPRLHSSCRSRLPGCSKPPRGVERLVEAHLEMLRRHQPRSTLETYSACVDYGHTWLFGPVSGCDYYVRVASALGLTTTDVTA
jgi:hypothetical protein